jgi:hypothetical protein
VEHRVTLDENVAPSHRPKIPPERWPEVRAAYPARTMRQLAADWGVCQETIRKIIRVEIPPSRRPSSRGPGSRGKGSDG